MKARRLRLWTLQERRQPLTSPPAKLTTTAAMAANTLTLTGPHCLTYHATTGTITDNGGTTVSDLRATFGSGGTFAPGRNGQRDDHDAATPFGAGETLNKIGTGTWRSRADSHGVRQRRGVKLRRGNRLAVRNNDDVTFNDDADEITVASGATLTEFPSAQPVRTITSMRLPVRRSI